MIVAIFLSFVRGEENTEQVAELRGLPRLAGNRSDKVVGV